MISYFHIINTLLISLLQPRRESQIRYVLFVYVSVVLKWI